MDIILIIIHEIPDSMLSNVKFWICEVGQKRLLEKNYLI